jgi:folate-binding protein YgfZ
MTTPSASSNPMPARDDEGLAAARHSAVLVDLAPIAVVEVRGPDAAAFLQSQLSSDVKGLADDNCQYTSYNSPKGRMLANFVLWRCAADRFRALVPMDLAPGLVRRLAMYVLRSKVTITDLSAATVRLGFGGAAARTAVAGAFGVVPGIFALATVREVTLLGLPGPRYVALAENSAAGDLPAVLARHARGGSFAVWQWLTIDAGVPVVTAATQELFIPQMLNWDVLGGINFQKGCYPGQEIVARTRYLGRLKERCYAFHADADDVVAATRLYSSVFGDQPCGTVVNAAPAPEGGIDLLAVVQIAAAESGDVRAHRPEGPRLLPRALPYAMPDLAVPPRR